MMDGIIAYLKQNNVHTPRLALARFLLALGMLLTIISNKLSIVANHQYTFMEGYTLRHGKGGSNAFAFADLYLYMPPQIANLIVVLILLFVMSGFLPKISCLLHYLACFSFHNYFIILNGGDDITLNLSLLLIPLCLTDNRNNQWKHPPELSQTSASSSNIVANLALIAIHLQAAWLYFDAFYPKMFTPQWLDGTALFYYTSHYRLGAPDWLRNIDEIITTTAFVRVLSWGALLLELILAFALLLPSRLKRKLFIPALCFHFLILIHFGLITFFIAIAGMLLLYLDNDDVITNKLLRIKKA
jgi:antimicrobial peptide system SdpB family protein